MSYQSPLHIIKQISGQEFQVNETNLLRLRKQLLADLNLSGQASLEINGKQYSKDGIIKTIDVLMHSKNLDLHEFIYSNKNLLAYLENEELNFSYDAYSKTGAPELLQQELEKTMTERFMLQFRKNISKREFDRAKEVILFINHLPAEKRDVCYEEVHKKLLALAAFISGITTSIKENESKKKWITKYNCIKGTDFRFLAKPEVADFLNTLPRGFDSAIDVFEASVINLMYHYHKQVSYDKKLTAGISHMLMKVRNCNETNYRLIRRNHNAYSASGSSIGKGTGGIVVFAVFIIIRVIIGLGAFSSHDTRFDNVHFSNTPPKFYTGISDTSSPDNSGSQAGPDLKLPVFWGKDEYIKNSIRYPRQAVENGTEGVVHVKFVVEADGTITNVKAVDSIGDGCEEEAVRVIRAMPPWTPATNKGTPIRVQFDQPVRFTLK